MVPKRLVLSAVRKVYLLMAVMEIQGYFLSVFFHAILSQVCIKIPRDEWLRCFFFLFGGRVGAAIN